MTAEGYEFRLSTQKAETIPVGLQDEVDRHMVAVQIHASESFLEEPALAWVSGMVGFIRRDYANCVVVHQKGEAALHAEAVEALKDLPVHQRTRADIAREVTVRRKAPGTNLRFHLLGLWVGLDRYLREAGVSASIPNDQRAELGKAIAHLWVLMVTLGIGQILTSVDAGLGRREPLDLARFQDSKSG